MATEVSQPTSPAESMVCVLAVVQASSQWATLRSPFVTSW